MMVWLRILGWISLGVLLGALAGALAREWTTRPDALGWAPSLWSPGPMGAKTVQR